MFFSQGVHSDISLNNNPEGSLQRSRSRSRSSSRHRSRSRRQLDESIVQEKETAKREGHAHRRLTHEENRSNTCVLCFRRRKRKGAVKSLGFRPVTPLVAGLIRSHTHHIQYDLENPAHPAALCNSDYGDLMKVKNAAEQRTPVRGKDPRERWSKLDLVGLVLPGPGVGGG